MPILIISASVGLVFALAGFLIWIILFIFRVRGHGRTIFRRSLAAYLVALPLFLFFFLPLLLSYLLSSASTRPDERNLTSNPNTFGRPYESVRFQSRDGVQLAGWLLPGRPAQPALIFSHGLFRNRNEVLERCARLNSMGWTTLLYDFRSHGKSGPARITLGYRERLDVLGAVDFVRQAAGRERVIVAGVSMGAVAGLLAAGEDPSRIGGVIADSAFISLKSTIRRHTSLMLGLPPFPFVELFNWNLSRLGDFPPEQLNVLEALPQLETVPILLIYGSEDRRMPPEVARELYQEIPGPSELLMVAGAGHGEAFEVRPDLYVDTVTRFFGEVAAEPGRPEADEDPQNAF